MKPLHPDGRRLIDAATAADAPSAGSEARIWDALSKNLAQPLPPTAAAASRALDVKLGSALLTSASAKLVISVVVAGVMGGSGIALYAAKHAPAADRNPGAQTSTALPVHGLPAASPALAADVPDQAPVPPAANLPLANAPATHPKATSGNLREEARLIAEAQRALSGGAPERALVFIERHRARFANGELAQERDLARVLALCALGRAREAQRARGAFLREYPKSPLAARVKSSCSDRP